MPFKCVAPVNHSSWSTRASWISRCGAVARRHHQITFRAVRAALSALEPPGGDGSVMEEGGGVWVLPLEEAIEACRTGAIPDMKTEIALLRLADHLAYVPSLGRFVDELPEDLRAAWSPLGTERARP